MRQKLKHKDIGIHEYQCKEGEEFWFYNYYSTESSSCSEPIKVHIISKVYNHIGGQPTVMVDNVSGVVALSHLSNNYYSEEYNKISKSSGKYVSYIDDDYSDSFSDYLGIKLPIREYGSWPQGGVRFKSSKYPSVIGDYCKTIKEANKSYKERLFEYKRNNKIIKQKYVFEYGDF